MCLVSPGLVTAIDGSTASLDVDGRHRAASILLEPDVVVGDWVIVAGGAVLRRIDAPTAQAMRSALTVAAPSQHRPQKGT
jgi:hydrogenase assembly chaperone HypC/HupF